MFALEGNVAKFSAVLQTEEDPSDLAVFPAADFRSMTDGVATIRYPYTYTYQENKMNAPMASLVADGEDLYFKHLGGMIRVVCPYVPVGAATFNLVARDNVNSKDLKIVGDFTLTPGENMSISTEQSSGYNTAIVKFAASEAITSKTFDIPVPTGTYPSIYAYFADADGNKIREWQVLTDVTVNRGDMFVRTMPENIMRVMSYNIRFSHSESDYKEANDARRWAARKLIVPGSLSNKYFDVMGSQENTTGQINDILTNSAMSGYAAVGRSNHNKASNELGYDSDNETAAIYYKNSAVQMIENGTFWYSNDYDSFYTGDWLLGYNMRCCNWAKLKYAGREFYVFNVHLQVNTTDDAKYKDMRLKQIKKVLKKIKEVSDDYPVILTGDFNCTPGKEGDVFQWLVAEGTMVEARSLVRQPHGPYGTLHYFQADNATSSRVDHVFINNKFDVQAYWTDNSQQKTLLWESDHNPVIVDLTFKN
jgi:endonuclease/exonuclease/phosphatase family metal-dependent hydrolase